MAPEVVAKLLEAVPTLAFALVIVWLWLQNGIQNKDERASRDKLWQDFFAMQRVMDREALAVLGVEMNKIVVAVGSMSAIVSDCDHRRDR